MSDLVKSAEEVARAAHASQKYGAHPYDFHLHEVVTTVTEILGLESMWFFDSDIARAGAWLHDTLEDTDVTYDQLLRRFGGGVAKLVLSVTDCPGVNRHERKKATYPKIRAAGALSVALKLADRISNVKQARQTPASGLLRMYQKEQAAFAGALYRFEDGLDSVWAELEGLLKNPA